MDSDDFCQFYHCFPGENIFDDPLSALVANIFLSVLSIIFFSRAEANLVHFMLLYSFIYLILL